MKIVLFGASGRIGRRILQEALRRNHSVTAIVRRPTKISVRDKRVRAVQGDITNAGLISSLVAGHDAVVCAVAPPETPDGAAMLSKAAQALIKGMRKTNVRRLVVVGGAGSLEVSPGVQLLDTPEFPKAYKALAEAHRDALAIYRAEKELDWSYFSPAAVIEPGQHTGAFRLGTDQLLVDTGGKSAISMEDYAVALLDELEHPRFIRKRFTAAY